MRQIVKRHLYYKDPIIGVDYEIIHRGSIFPYLFFSQPFRPLTLQGMVFLTYDLTICYGCFHHICLYNDVFITLARQVIKSQLYTRGKY